MEICVKSFDGEKYTVEVGVDDTTADIRRKVASAAELCEDGFAMSFGGKLLAEGDDTTQLSAGDTIVLTKTKSQNAIAALRDLGETTLTTERFERLRDPKLVHLFLQAEVVTEIPNSFLYNGTFEEVDLSDASVVTTIGKSFLCSCTSLHTADVSGWSNVRHTGNLLLCNCTSLTTLDISGWNNVTHIGESFLCNCFSLRTVDLSGWNNVTHIGISFLSHCNSLASLDISGWSNVTHIENHFLRNCTSLTTLDLSGWVSVTHILGTNFLSNVPASSINATGSSLMSECVSAHVRDRDCDLKRRKCVCM